MPYNIKQFDGILTKSKGEEGNRIYLILKKGKNYIYARNWEFIYLSRVIQELFQFDLLINRKINEYKEKSASKH